MSTSFERLILTVPAETVAAIKQAVEDGEYSSTNDVVQDALRHWTARRQPMLGALSALKADIDQGMADVAAGRLKTFDMAAIIRRGKQPNTPR